MQIRSAIARIASGTRLPVMSRCNKRGACYFAVRTREVELQIPIVQSRRGIATHQCVSARDHTSRKLQFCTATEKNSGISRAIRYGIPEPEHQKCELPARRGRYGCPRWLPLVAFDPAWKPNWHGWRILRSSVFAHTTCAPNALAAKTGHLIGLLHYELQKVRADKGLQLGRKAAFRNN